MRSAALRVGLAAASLLAPPAAQACLPPPALLFRNAAYAVAATPDPAPIEIGRHFSLDLIVCAQSGSPSGRILAIDAQMPTHRHGMNYAPRLVAQADGRARAEGLMLHMPGLWRLSVEIDVGGKRERLELDLTLE